MKSLREKILWSFLTPLILGVFAVMVVFASILGVKQASWISTTGDSLSSEELDNLNRLATLKASFVDETFSQSTSQMMMLKGFSENLLNESILVDKTLLSSKQFFSVSSVDSSLPSGMQTLKENNFSLDSTTYFKRQSNHVYNASTLHSTNSWMNSSPQDLSNGGFRGKLSALLYQMFRPIHQSSSLYQALYLGFSATGAESLYRLFPYQRQDSLTSISITCYQSGISQIGYSPDCRVWYGKAIEKFNQVSYSPPYLDALGFGLVITPAITINTKGTSNVLPGVLGSDFTITQVKNVVGESILDNGYGYLIDRATGAVVIHPSLDPDSSVVPPLNSLEFTDNDNEATGFLSIFNSMKSGASSADLTTTPSFRKNGDLWYIQYRRIASTNWELALVVPEKDILAPAERVKKSIVTGILVTMLILGVVVFFLVGGMVKTARQIASQIEKPIASLTELVQSISRKDLTREFSKDAEACAEVTLLQNTFQTLVTAIRFGNSEYLKGNLSLALKSYNEAHDMFHKLQNHKGMAICENNTANIYVAQGKFDQAIAIYQRSISQAQASLLNAQDSLLHDMRQRDKDDNNNNPDTKVIEVEMKEMPPSMGRPESLKQREEALREAKLTLASRQANEAYCLYLSEKFSAARVVLQEVMKLDSESRAPLVDVAQHVGQLGKCHLALGDVGAARDATSHCLTISYSPQYSSLENLDDSCFARALSCKNMADIYESEKDYPSQVRWLQASLEYSGSLISKDLANEVLYKLVEAYGNINNSSLADTIKATALSLGFSPRPPSSAHASFSLKEVVFLLDYSGSMAGSQIRTCVNNMVMIIEKYLRPGDRVSLQTFNRSVQNVFQDVPQERVDFNRIRNLTRPHSATAFWDATGSGIELMNRSKHKDFDRWLIALTDGESNSDSHYGALSILPKIARANCTFILMAVGRLANRDDLQRAVLANKEKPGLFLEISHGNQALNEAFEKVASIIAAGALHVETL